MRRWGAERERGREGGARGRGRRRWKRVGRKS